MFSDEVHNVSLAADHDPMDYDLVQESSAKEFAGYIQSRQAKRLTD